MLHLTLAIARAVERTLDLQEVSVDVVPGVRMIDQAVLDTGRKHAIGMLFPLLVALVIQRSAAKEQDAHGKRQDKAKHVEYKAGIEQHRSPNATECHGANRQRHDPRGTADYHATTHDFKAIDQQEADE